MSDIPPVGQGAEKLNELDCSLTCNLKQSGRFHHLVRLVPPPPAFTPYRRDLHTAFRGQQRWRWRRRRRRPELPVGGQNECFPTAATRHAHVRVSGASGMSEISSLPNHITGTGTLTGGPPVTLMDWNMNAGHTQIHAGRGNRHAFIYTCM